MPNKVSICLIKIEINAKISEEFGAVSAEHPTNPRLIKERERDRGLRNYTEITIETYTNQFPGTQANISAEELADLLAAAAAVQMMSAKNSQQQFVQTTTNSSSRETTPRDETTTGQCAPEFPKEICYFSGNPSVEVTNGIIHLFKKNERKEIKEGPSNQLCLLAVPASLSCHDLLSFVGPCHSQIQHIRIVRDGSPNQFMVLLEFRNNESALEFYQTFNGAAYNSLEPESLCHAVWVSAVERGEDGLAPLGHTELPTCPVCLERMDESVDGVLTILCNHAFHANCLIKWGDSTCPVCRHVQTPELMENSVCMECEGTDSLWICLICGHVGCGRYQGGHAAAHYRATNHAFALQLGTSSVWDYAGDNFVHRLFQNKTDGKLVAANGSPTDEGEEKIDSMQLEFTYLLTSQLDAQRKYYEERMTQMEKEWQQFQLNANIQNKKVEGLEEHVMALKKEKENLQRKLTVKTNKLAEVQKLLSEEQQITKALQNNQSGWQEKYEKLKEQLDNLQKHHDSKVDSLEQQLRDVMFYIEAQNQIAESNLKDEIEGGTIVLPEVEASTSSGKSAHRRKKKH